MDASISKGKYRVIEVLPVSQSLYSLKCGRDRDSPSPIHKALLQDGRSNRVVYFIDLIDFGAGSKILLKEKTETALLRGKDYVVLERKKYRVNAALAEKLLEAVVGSRQRCK